MLVKHSTEHRTSTGNFIIMSDVSSVGDSQPDIGVDEALSWDIIEKEQTRSTRKARQLDKLFKELRPLNNEYKNIPTNKSRNISFSQNNQFTVVAAEFLNLSTKSELDKLFDSGYTKDEIENMLENKYQEKKQFFTDLNVKHHKFKRKNFESWRSMTNSHSTTNNMFSSEEELISNITKPQRLRLKRINNKALSKYKGKIMNKNIETPTDDENQIRSTHIEIQSETTNPPSSPIHHRTRSFNVRHENIPKEDGLIGISLTDEASSSILLVSNMPGQLDAQATKDKVSQHPSSPLSKYSDAEASLPLNDDFLNSKTDDMIKTKDSVSSIIEPDINQSKSDKKLPLFSKKNEIAINDFFNLDIHSQHEINISQSGENEIIPNHRISNENDIDLQIPNTQLELQDIFSEKKDTTNISLENIQDNLNHQEPSMVYIISSPTANPTPTGQYIQSGRSLRHRTIVNRNPYLVDRAEYLGLSTKYELIALTEEGKTDDEIMNYLDDKYQRRRRERKEKDVGYGPFAKNTFFEIMSGKDHNLSTSDNNNVDSITNPYISNDNNDISDQEFELSMDEESVLNDEPDNEESDNEELDNEESDNKKSAKSLKQNSVIDILESFGDIGNVSDKPGAKRKKLPYNLNEALKETPEIDHMVQSKKRKHTSATTREKHKNISKLTEKSRDKIGDKKKRRKIKDSLENPHQKSKLISNNSSHFEMQTPTFKPYSMDFLTLSDDETAFSTKNTKSKRYESTESHQPPKNKEDFTYNKKTSNSEISTIMGKISSHQHKSAKVLKPQPTNLEESRKESNKNKSPKKVDKNSIGTYAPLSDANFLFNRQPNIGTYQQETLAPRVLANKEIETVTEFDIENAKNTGLRLFLVDELVENTTVIKPKNMIQDLWNKYKDIKNLKKHRYQFIINLKPLDYKNLEIPQKFLGSSFLEKTLSENNDFYRNEDITLEFASMKLFFAVPLKPETTLAQIIAFHDILLGELKLVHISKSLIKQLRKALIDLIMILSNIKKDCPSILPSVGLEMNSFLNRYKNSNETSQVTFCVFAPFYLIYMKLFQKFLPSSSEYLSSFKNTESWLCKRIVFNVCSIPFEKVFIYPRNTFIESIFIFLKCTSNPLQYFESLQHSKDIDILNIFNFLYFCNSHHPVEMDWEFFTSVLNKLCDKLEKPQGDLFIIKSIFASVLKLNRELHWDLEDQLLIRMFRLLAEYKFENIGSDSTDKSTIYPNIPVTDSLEESDGCLDIYFKVLNIYTKQYLSESTKSLVERLIPIRSTFGYSPVQLQNRAKVLLMMVYTFDQDLLSSLESILNDMIRNGSVYSIKSSLALIKTIVRQTPKRPYSLVRKFLPTLINKIHNIPPDREIVIVLNDLIYTVNELLNGQDISHLKRILDFFSIILRFKYADIDTAFDTMLGKTFMIISQQFEFLQGIAITAKDETRLKKSLTEIINNAKSRLLNERIVNFGVNKLLLKYWLYSSMKCKQSAIQLLYTEWNYFGDAKLRDKYELTFFTYLVQMFEVSNIKEDIMCIFFKHLPMLHTDVSSLFQQMNKKHLLLLNKKEYETISSQMFKFRKVDITIECLSKLLKEKNEQFIFNILKSFIVSLKLQLVNHEAKSYIKEIGLYLFTVAGDRFDIPEWDYLLSKLKLETVEGSLSKKIQFVETVDDSIMVFEKAYVSSLSEGAINQFEKQFTEFIELQIDRTRTLKSLCGLVSFHIECVLKQEKEHWIYLNYWIKNLRRFITVQICKLDVSFICIVLCNLARLHKLYLSCDEFKSYYYSILSEVYYLLEWCLRTFIGFDDYKLFLTNFWYFAGMDPIVDERVNNYSNISAMVTVPLIQKLLAVYQSSDIYKQEGCDFTDRDMYVLEEKIEKQRSELVKIWNIPDMKL